MKVITRNEMVWDASQERYITTYESSYDFGWEEVDQCKGGGAKGIIGLVASIAIPFAAPAIAGSFLGSVAIGAGIGLVTGGVKGALLGGIGGGLGSYFRGLDSAAGSGAAGLSGGADLATAVPGTGVSAFTDGASALSGAAAATAAPSALAGDLSSGISSGLGSAATAAQDVTSPLLSSGGSNSVLSGLTDGASSSAAGLATQIPGTGAGAFLNGGAASNTAFDTFKNSVGNVLNTPGVKEAGLKLGAQALGNALTPTPQGATLNGQEGYLNNLQAQSNQAFGLNINQNAARNADAGSVEKIAANYDPQYLGNNAATIAKNRDSAGWADTEARLRTQGFSEAQIASERNRFDTQSSQNQGTAYTQGVATGINQQAGLYGQGASIRQNVAEPGGGLASAYAALAGQATTKRDTAGKAIQDAAGPLLGMPNIGAKTTTPKPIDTSQQAGQGA